MSTTNSNQSFILNTTKVNQYTKNGLLMNVYTVAGDSASVKQYEADQASKPKGCQYHEVTKAPLFWSSDIGSQIVRGKDGNWRISNDLERAVSQKIKSLNRVGNDLMADKLADRLADKMLENIEAMYTKRKPSTSTGTPEGTPEGTPAEKTEGLNGV